MITETDIGLAGVNNARELGGYPAADGKTVRHGVLLRTARLSGSTDDDLRRLKEVYRLARIIDLRSDEEINGSPEIAMFTGSTSPDLDPTIEEVDYIHLPVLDMQKQMKETDEWSRKHGIYPVSGLLQMLTVSMESGFVGDGLYIRFLEDDFGKQSYKQFLRELIELEEGRAILFHCTQGKDRTGVAAMLILSALGVPEEVIIEDYMLTNIYNSDRIAKERKMLEALDGLSPEKIERYLMVMDKVNESTMTSVITHLKEKYGSVKNFITIELEVSDTEIEMLKDKFLL